MCLMCMSSKPMPDLMTSTIFLRYFWGEALWMRVASAGWYRPRSLEASHDHVGQVVAGIASVPLLPADHQIDERLVAREIHG